MAEQTTENKGEIIGEFEEGEKPDESSVKMEKSRKEKRKDRKKMKRRQLRREAAEMEKKAVEALLNDPAEQEKLERAASEERAERERALKEFEERERAWIELMEKKKKAEEEEEEEEEENKRKILLEASREQKDGESGSDNDDWEYVEEGPAEIIWQGNEIIVKKKKVKVPKKETSQMLMLEDADRPTSNPLPPQSEVFTDYLSAASAQQLLENVAKEVPNFGTEQDKAHCPFHLKTGACRFGQRCSRVHFYPDKSCTLLIKSMYNGPGLTLDQDEGLEYTDEEIGRCYEEFYEDVHTEFLKFGEILNFKVCRNGSFHLRGNVYVHYKTLESSLCAYHAVNGRYFAGKQIQCEFVNVTKWKVAICGEFMKSRLKTCSRGSACNFIHCFRNPGGDYEWADWDKPPPRYWVKRMASLFGYSDQSASGETMESGHLRQSRSSSMMTVSHSSSWHRSRRLRSGEIDKAVSRHRSSDDEDDFHDTRYQKRHKYHDRNESSVESQKARHHHDRTRSFSNGDRSAMDMEEGCNSELVGLHHAREQMKSKHQDEVSGKESEKGVGDDFIIDSDYEDHHSQFRNERTRKRSKERNIKEDSGKRPHQSETQFCDGFDKESHHHHNLTRGAGSPTDEYYEKKRSREDAGSGTHHSYRQKKSSRYRDKDGECSDDHEKADNHHGYDSDETLERNRSDQYYKREPTSHTNKVSKSSDDLYHQENKWREKPDSKRHNHSRTLDHWGDPPASEEVLGDDADGMDRWKPESPEQEEKSIAEKDTRDKSGDSDQHHRKRRSNSRHRDKRRSRHKENERDSSVYEDYGEDVSHSHRSRNRK